MMVFTDLDVSLPYFKIPLADVYSMNTTFSNEVYTLNGGQITYNIHHSGLAIAGVGNEKRA